MKLVSVFLLALLYTTTGAAQTLHAPTSPARLAEEFRSGVYALADDSMEGRGLTTQGIHKAADWIERELKSRGFQPAFGQSYRQPFDIKTGVHPTAGNRLEDVPDTSWVPLGFSSSGSFTGELAFLGYGIEAPELHYRELQGIDLKGKIAVMLRYEPQEKDSASVFDGRKPSRWSALRYKVMQARERGASAVIFVTGPLQDEGKDKIPALANDGPESPAGIPAIQVKTSVAQRWLSRVGIDLRQFQEKVDRDLKPRSVASTGIHLSGAVALKSEMTQAENLAGLIPGTGALKNEYVVIGGHYDHLGYGGEHSMRPNEHAIHNGADDNASGTIGAILIGQELEQALRGVASHRSVLVCLFSGEEVGLAGSAWFVQHPPVPVAKIAAMINLDMVGRLRQDQLIALGSDTAPQWKEMVERGADRAQIHVTSKGDGYGPSDQTSFYAAGVPVLFLFTGSHEQYHTPEDKPATVNPDGAAKVIVFAISVADDLARAKTRPQYVRASSAPAMQGDSRGYGSYLGTIPDYSAMESSEGGVLLSDVRPGGPADLAGIRGKDRIVAMAGTRIENLYDMTYALQDHKPGETIEVVVIRDGQKVTLRATLGQRSASGMPPADHGGTPGTPPKPHAAFMNASASKDLVVGAGKPYDKAIPEEKHLTDVRQLTFGGENAEPYWAPDGRHIIFASTHAASDSCPPPPDRSHGYVWAIYDSYDIYEANPDGSDLRPLIQSPGYDAEATWCHKGGKFIFTSTRDGDLDLYVRKDDGTITRMTNTPGYDGGAFFSPDCSQIVWRASRPQGKELEEYKALLKQGLIRPHSLEIYLMKADGTGAKALTHNGAANFCPTFLADGNRILWSSNAGQDPREFDLWMVDTKGGDPERITYAPGFDGFPHVSPDGRWVVWSSNRADPASHETNLFIARWKD